MPEWNSVEKKRDWLLADLRKGLEFKPDRGRDLYTMMKQYVREVEHENRDEALASCLNNIVACAQGGEYPDPYPTYITADDVNAIENLLNEYLDEMKLGQIPTVGEILGIKLIGKIRDLDAGDDKWILDTLRRETLADLVAEAKQISEQVVSEETWLQPKEPEMGGL